MAYATTGLDALREGRSVPAGMWRCYNGTMREDVYGTYELGEQTDDAEVVVIAPPYEDLSGDWRCWSLEAQ